MLLTARHFKPVLDGRRMKMEELGDSWEDRPVSIDLIARRTLYLIGAAERFVAMDLRRGASAPQYV